MKKKFLSYLLAAAMMLSVAPVSVFAEDETTEDTTTEVSDTFVYEMLPENYATIYLQTDGYHTKSRTINAYYNTPYTANAYIYTEHGSIISSYNVPAKNALTAMAVSYNTAKGSGITSSRYIPIVYDTNKFGIDATAGIYASDSTEYAAIKAYSDNYWCSTGTTEHKLTGLNFANQVAAKITETTTGYIAYDVTSTALTAFLADTDEEYLTFATAREVSGYTDSALGLKTESVIPKLTLTYSKTALLPIINATAEADMPEVIDDLGTIGGLADSTAGYAGYTALSERLQKYACEVLTESKGSGFADYEAFLTAYDAAVTAASNVSAGDPIETEILPVNYASIHIFDGGYHGYAREEAVYYNTPYTENAKLYAESGSVITSYEVPLKDSLDGMAVKYSINTAGQMSNGTGVPVFYDLNKFEIDVPAGKYAMASDDDVTVEETATETPVEGEEEEEGSDGAVDIPEEEVTVDVYALTKAYTDNYFPSSDTSYSYSGKAFANQVAFSTKSSSTGRIAHDVTSTALAAYVADTNANYITFATGRETSGYINFSVNVSAASYIPTLVLTYNATDIIDYINSASSADALEEIFVNLGKAGILDKGTYGYAGYTGMGEKFKSAIRTAVYEEIAKDGYLTFTDFINAYDAAVLTAANSVIDNPDAYINFNDGTANDTSGNGRNASIVGAELTTGPDGSKALKVTNSFGKTAQQYLDMGVYDFSEDSFSIVFWMKAENRGIDFEGSGDSITSGTVVDFSTYTGTKGGVALSNKDFSVNDNTGFAFAAMPIYTDFSYNMKMSDGSAVNTIGVQTASDSRWHQLAYVVNRSGNATFYVDGTVVKATDISSLTGSLGTGNLIFGADGLGQYGMMHGEFDDIKIYSSALEATKIQELYYITALKKVNNEIDSFLDSDKAKSYSDENITALEAELADSEAFVNSYAFGNLDGITAQYEAIDTYYNDFLLKDLNGIAGFVSDVHISENNENHLSAQNLKRFLQEGQSWATAPETFIVSGDIADVGADDMGYFFEYVGNWMVDGSNMVICRGNHDEPVGTDKATGITYTREQMLERFKGYMDGYVDKTQKFNESVVTDGTLTQPYYYTTDGVAHYITIDNYLGEVRTISNAQFTWLEGILEEVSGDGKPIIIVQHLPMLGSIETGTSDLSLKSAYDTKLKALLKNYDNVFVLSGHKHYGFGSGSGNPECFDGVWQINTPTVSSKTISRGYEWSTGYYIAVQDGYVTFRARDFENQKWLRDYDLTFELTEAKALPSDVEAECTENFNDATLSDGEYGASVWEGTIEGTGTSYEKITATATDKDGKEAMGTYSETTISGNANVAVIVVINRMKELLESVVLSVQ